MIKFTAVYTVNKRKLKKAFQSIGVVGMPFSEWYDKFYRGRKFIGVRHGTMARFVDTCMTDRFLPAHLMKQIRSPSDHAHKLLVQKEHCNG